MNYYKRKPILEEAYRYEGCTATVERLKQWAKTGAMVKLLVSPRTTPSTKYPTEDLEITAIRKDVLNPHPPKVILRHGQWLVKTTTGDFLVYDDDKFREAFEVD